MIKVKVTVDVQYEGKEEIEVEVKEYSKENVWEAVNTYMRENYYGFSFSIVHVAKPVLI